MGIERMIAMTDFESEPRQSLPKIRVPLPAARDSRALTIDFNQLRDKAKGSYVLARQALWKAKDEQKSRRMRRVELELCASPKAKEAHTIVRMSTMTGVPSLCSIQQSLCGHRRSKPPPPSYLPPSASTEYSSISLGKVEPGSKYRRMTPKERLQRMREIEEADIRARDNQSAADLLREQQVRGAFISADKLGSGALDRQQFRNALLSLGFLLEGSTESQSKQPIPLAKLTEAEWWHKATKNSLSNTAEMWELCQILRPVCEAIEADEAERQRQRETGEQKRMQLEDNAVREIRECGMMFEEDTKQNPSARQFAFLEYRPFASAPRFLAPAPPRWRVRGATGESCEPPTLRECAATSHGYRALFTHSYVCNEAGLEHTPAILCTTLFMQLGLDSLKLPRNKLQAIVSPGANPQITCQIKLPASLQTLVYAVDWSVLGTVDLMIRLQTHINLNDNALHVLPDSFLHLEQLAYLHLRNNNFQRLPDEMGALRSLVALDVSENVLVRLPSTLPRLCELQDLKLSGNGLISLAVLPSLRDLAGVHVPGAEAWQARVEPLTRRSYFVNVETRKIQRLLPAVLGQARARQKAVEMLLEHDPKDGGLEIGSKEYNSRRQRMAFSGISEWSFEWNVVENCILYSNVLTGRVCPSMPDILDALGKLKSLTELRVDRNRLRELPNGLTQIKSLKKLIVRENYIRVLPDNLGDMKLIILDLANNELSSLPESMGQLSTLELLVIQENRFERLPAFVGRLQNLSSIRAGHNALTTLPYEIGFAESLTELQVYDNPLEADWYESIADITKLKWLCRQKFWFLKNGPLPTVDYTHTSICDEVFEPTPAHKMRIDAAVEASKTTGKLELQLQGVHEIPGAVVKRGQTREEDEWSHPKLESLLTLKLNMNAFTTGVPLFTKSLSRLRVLWLKECSLTRLDDNIEELQGLIELDLEANAIYNLPRTFSRLRRLARLNLSKNKLQSLPINIGRCTSLERIDVSMNRIERLPESITQLRNLVDLSVACNCLFTLPVLSPGLSKLTRLNIDANELHVLPARLGELPLVFLHAGHNRLEWLSSDTFGPTTTTTLEYVDLVNNNLLELPSCLPSCTRITTLQVEYNPMRNPPPELLSQGMAILKQYYDVRHARIAAFEQLLSDYDFDYEPAHLAPRAYDVLTGRTGFLMPDDLDAFDKAVDAYLNGPYYKNSTTDTEIMERIDAVRHEREHVFYHDILQELVNVLHTQFDEQEARSRLFGCGVLVEVQRPWGRKGEDVGAYALALDALVNKSEPRQFVRKPRPALFDMVRARLPPSIFDYSLEFLKDAITKYEGPYGTVAQLDKVQYERCECVDERGRTKGHKKCVLPSVVIAKTIYSAGEAQRRVAEDDRIRTSWMKLWGDIEAALDTKLGKVMADREMFRRQNDQGIEIKRLRRAIQDKRKLVRRAADNHKAAQSRKKSFEDGGEYDFHRIETQEDAERLVSEAATKLENRRQSLVETERELANIRALGKIKKEVCLQKIASDLKQKYCVIAYERIVDENRRKAFANNWRRPWDGEEGREFKDWCHKFGAAMRAGHEVHTVARWVRQLGSALDRDEEEDTDSAKEQAFYYDWLGTEEMETFENARYFAFEESFAAEAEVKSAATPAIA